MLKTTTSAALNNIGDSNNIFNPNNKKVASDENGSEKVKTLAKAKNIKELAKFKKSDFTKTKIDKAFGTDFFILKARKTFIQLKKTFTKVPIFCNFHLEYHI